MSDKTSELSIDKLKKLDPVEIGMGVQHELEHTSDSQSAESRAQQALKTTLDHLKEDPDYNKKLQKMEKLTNEQMQRCASSGIEDGATYPASEDSQGKNTWTPDSERGASDFQDDHTNLEGHLDRPDTPMVMTDTSVIGDVPLTGDEFAGMGGDTPMLGITPEDKTRNTTPNIANEQLLATTSYIHLRAQADRLYDHFLDHVTDLARNLRAAGVSRTSAENTIRQVYASLFEFKPWITPILASRLDRAFGTAKQGYGQASHLLEGIMSFVRDAAAQGITREAASTSTYEEYRVWADQLPDDVERCIYAAVDQYYGAHLATYAQLVPGARISHIWMPEVRGVILASINEHADYGVFHVLWDTLDTPAPDSYTNDFVVCRASTPSSGIRGFIRIFHGANKQLYISKDQQKIIAPEVPEASITQPPEEIHNTTDGKEYVKLPTTAS